LRQYPAPSWGSSTDRLLHFPEGYLRYLGLPDSHACLHVNVVKIRLGKCWEKGMVKQFDFVFCAGNGSRNLETRCVGRDFAHLAIFHIPSGDSVASSTRCRCSLVLCRRRVASDFWPTDTLPWLRGFRLWNGKKVLISSHPSRVGKRGHMGAY